MPRPRDAADTVAQIMTGFDAATAVLRQWGVPSADIRRLADRAAHGQPLIIQDDSPLMRLVHGTANPRKAQAVRGLCVDVAQQALWNEHKVIYNMDADLWEDLSATRDDDLIPLAMFERLPHPDPFILFGKPIEVTDTRGERHRVIGMFVNGVYGLDTVSGNTAAHLCSTADPRRRAFQLNFISFALDDDGTPKRAVDGSVDQICWRSTLDYPNPLPTFAQLFEHKKATFQVILTGGLGNDLDVLQVMFRAGIASLLYICSKEPEIERNPGPKVKRDRKSGLPVKPSLYNVGFRVGARLAAWREREDQMRAASVGTGRKQATHRRRGHNHLYWTGKGRTIPQIKFVEPYWVNVDAPAPDVPTVRQVK